MIPRLPRIAYGGDYNPEQWPREVWDEDVRLMRDAGVNFVSVGIFSWALLEPKEGSFEMGWLDDVLDLLHSNGISIDLATATASPPPWLSHRYPETLPVTYEGRRMWPGGRQAWCPSSPIFREKALALVEQMASRYGHHPGLVLWHVSNELGCHNAHCYCDVSAAAFRRWLRNRYGDVDALNDAWGTAFWSQRYGDWDEVLPPRLAPTFPNPTQQLDFRRFSSDELLAYYTAEQQVLRRHTPEIPVTTNFMVAGFKDMDYHSWAPAMDVVSNDHYLLGELSDSHVQLAFSADTTRGLAGGGPWLLMEHSTSAVNWQPRNLAKLPGQMMRNSLQHVARGADGVCFFQWRASRAGAEKFHSGLVPHAGTDTKIWREVVELGSVLRAIDEVRGTSVVSDVALLFDYPAWWACELDSHPSVDVTYLDQAHRYYRGLWEAGTTVDVVDPETELDGYRLVVVPTLYLVSDAAVRRLEHYVLGGGTVLVTYFSGIVDEADHIRLGGYPGAFRELLGVVSEEFFPLRPGEQVSLDDGAIADVWTELLHLDGAEAVARYVDGPLPGVPAVTRHQSGHGSAWYAATRLDMPAVRRPLERVLDDAGLRPTRPPQPGVELVRRAGEGRSYLFVINHTEEDVTIPSTGRNLLTGTVHQPDVQVPAGGVAVLREEDQVHDSNEAQPSPEPARRS
jgi:beta-galactosidase